MRIAVIATTRNPLTQPFAGGQEAQTAAVLRGMRRAGHTVRLYARDGTDLDLCDELAACLAWFDGYADRLSSALRRVDAGQCAWSTPRTGTPATWSGSSSTRTCRPPSASRAARTAEQPGARRPGPGQRVADSIACQRARL